MLLDLLVPASHAAPECGERILCRHPFDHQKRASAAPGPSPSERGGGETSAPS